MSEKDCGPTQTENDIAEMRWDGDGTEWSAMRAAEMWVRSEGYSVGPTDRTHVRGVVFEPDVLIAKWHNLTADEKRECDATIVGSSRNGPLRLLMVRP